MKTKSILPICALALTAAFGPRSARAQVGGDAVRIEVRVQSEQDRKDIAKSSADTITQHKTLTILLSGKAKSPETRTGKWTAYGRSLKTHDVSVLDSGDFKIDFASGGQKFESKRINTTYTPEHANVSTSRGRSKATKVAAEGTKFIGYVVVVTDGGKVVGEFSDPSGLKAEASK